MKLNPTKCAFRVSVGKFLGFIVNNRGIEASPNKIKAVLDMPPPSNIKEVQRLTGRIAALSRFVSKASDKCQPFFQVLKKSFPMGCTLRRSIHSVKNLSELSPHSGKSLRGRAPYSVPGRFRFLNQRRPGQGQRQSAAASLLLQPSSERGRGNVPKDGEIDPDIGNRNSKTLPLLPSSYHRNPNRISNETSATQTRDLWKIDEVGHRAKRVRH